jgi:hypothetical protein
MVKWQFLMIKSPFRMITIQFLMRTRSFLMRTNPREFVKKSPKILQRLHQLDRSLGDAKSLHKKALFCIRWWLNRIYLAENKHFVIGKAIVKHQIRRLRLIQWFDGEFPMVGFNHPNLGLLGNMSATKWHHISAIKRRDLFRSQIAYLSTLSYYPYPFRYMDHGGNHMKNHNVDNIYPYLSKLHQTTMFLVCAEKRYEPRPQLFSPAFFQCSFQYDRVTPSWDCFTGEVCREVVSVAWKPIGAVMGSYIYI